MHRSKVKTEMRFDFGQHAPAAACPDSPSPFCPNPEEGNMAKSDNHKQPREFYIFDPTTGGKIPVTEEQFREYYRPINRIHAFAKRHHQCACHHWWLCCGDCTVCDWARDPEQDALARLYYDLEAMDSDRRLSYDPEAALQRKEFRRKAEAFLELLTGELRRIYDLYDEGKTQDEIANVMGVSQDTIHRRLKKIKEDFKSFYEG
jgi:RNA polymerase sigma factor (sigma-70 family)